MAAGVHSAAELTDDQPGQFHREDPTYAVCDARRARGRRSWRSGPRRLGRPQGPYARAIFESWGSLLASGLLARDHEQSGPWYFVTRRGEELARDPKGPARLAAERRIGVALHKRLERRIRRQFLIGEYELAAFAAMREVEIRVRELAGAGNAPGDLGVKLVQREFGDGGSLADPGAEAGERQATMALFWGALGVFKNPSSHREVEFDDPTEASDVVLFADLLLRILDRVATRSEAEDD